MEHTYVRVGRRGVVVIPKRLREKLGIAEGSLLEVRVSGNSIILVAEDLWSKLRARASRLKGKVDLEEAEAELDEADEEWLKRPS